MAAQQALANALLHVAEETEKRLDAELEALQNMRDDDIEAVRRKRLQELRDRQQKMAQWRQLGHGQYDEIPDQAAWFAECKSNDRVICHFYRPSTWRCEIVDKHLTALAKTHMETRFIKINAEKAPFLAERLNIYMLPTIICTKDNQTLDRVEGFDELGGVDEFPTSVMEKRLARKHAIDIDEAEARIARGRAAEEKMNSIRQSQLPLDDDEFSD